MTTNSDRLFTGVIIVLAIVGISYFGYNTFAGGSDGEKPNPYEYNIDYYKEYDLKLLHYNEIKQIPLNFEQVRGIDVGPEDELYVSGDNEFRVFGIDGNLIHSVNCGLPALCLNVDNNKDVYLGMTNHIQVFDDQGILKSRWESAGKEALITSINVTSNYVYVADAGNFIVWQYDKQGKVVRRIGEKDKSKDIPGFVIPSAYFDLAIDPDGFLWVTNPGRQSLENYTADGTFRSSWGTAGMKMEEFCGCCNPSHFTILNDGAFVTGEKGIARVKVLNRHGKLISVVAGPDQFTEGTVGIDLAIDSKNRIYVLDPMRKQVRIFEKKAVDPGA